jgi:hypothetical protein
MAQVKTKLKLTKAVSLALEVLSLPEGPTYQELAKQARSYLHTLTPEEKAKLTEEALAEKGSYSDDYADKLDLFRQMLFSPRECQAYAGMRIDSPGIRKMVARRALLVAMRGWDKLPKEMIHPDIVRMEDAFLVDDDGVPLTEDQILQLLRKLRR